MPAYAPLWRGRCAACASVRASAAADIPEEALAPRPQPEVPQTMKTAAPSDPRIPADCLGKPRRGIRRTMVVVGRVSPVEAGAAPGRRLPASQLDAVRSDYLVFGSPALGEEEIAEGVATLRPGSIG